MTLTRAERRAAQPRRPLLRSYRFWIPVGILFVLLIVGGVAAVIGKQVYDNAMAAKSSLEKAMPLASKAADQVIAGDSEGAKATASQLAKLTADAKKQTSGDLWKSIEWVPVAGPNLHAVRTAAAVTDDLVRDALTPATSLSLDALKPKDGAIDLAGIESMQTVVDQSSQAVDKASKDLESIDRDALIDQVDTAVGKLTGAIDELQPMLKPASEILGVLPAALGAEKPRHYLMIFQNNAEARGTGGNPAALVMIDVDKGKISIGQQASSSNFKNGRADPVTKLDPQTTALYGDNVGRWVPDATMTPDFPESAQIMRAWWAEEFGSPIDAVISFDPVALSYLLKATGPAVVPNDPVSIKGRMVRVLDEPVTLTSDNAVPFLLNQVYWDYDQGPVQDAIFAGSARAIFDVLTSGKAKPKPLLEALTRAVEEGRLMYQPATPEEADLVGTSKLAGKLPESNEATTVVGVYVNDFTTSKLDYYMQLDTAVSSTCEGAAAPAFKVTAELENTVRPADAAGLPHSISPAKYFPKGHIATNLVLYGPIGAKAVEVMIDGKAVSAKTVQHLGRPAVKVPVHNSPGESHTVTVEFAGAAGDYGDLELRHTPMVRPTSADVTSGHCG